MKDALKHPRNWLVAGGVASSAVLLIVGIAAIIAGLVGFFEVRDTLADENIVGPEDSTIPGQLVDTGSEARAMADIMREHTLARTGGLTYAEMGRYATPDGNPKGTNDANAAAKGPNGNPLTNTSRDLWVTETALSTSLNTAYFAERVGVFAVVVGVALGLAGIGFFIFAFGVLRHTPAATASPAAAADTKPEPAGTPGTQG